MSEYDTKKASRTDWERLETMNDDDIDYTDIPPLSDEFFQRAQSYVPSNRTIILDSDVFNWFIEQGQEYQTLIKYLSKSFPGLLSKGL